MDNQNKEIDLIEVFGKLLNKIHDNKILFFSIILIFVIIGSVYSFNKKKTFTYTTMATSSIDKEILKKIINDINKANYTNLLFKKIDNIGIEYDKSEAKYKYFDVNLRLNDTTNIKQTIGDIVLLLKNIPYIKEFVGNEKHKIKNQIKYYSEEIERINKIQKLVLEGNNSTTTTTTTIISTNGMSKEKLEIMSKRNELEDELKELRIINFVDSDYISFSSDKNLVFYVFLSLFLGSIFSIFIIVIKK